MLPRSRCLLLLVALVVPSPARAKSTRDMDYRYETVWSTAMRLLRVDKSYTVRDKDKDNGFILFVYPGSGSVKDCAASLEILRMTDDHGYDRRRLQLTIAHQPSYVEVQLLDALERKLLEEHGRPPAAQKSRAKQREEQARRAKEKKQREEEEKRRREQGE